MAHGINTMLKRAPATCKIEGKTGVGSRRIFPPHFKLQVLDSYRNDADCKGNQRATARKYGIHRRQIQKWLQVENNLRNSVKGKNCGDMSQHQVAGESRKCGNDVALRNRLSGDMSPDAYSRTPEAPRVPDPLETTGPGVPLDFTTHGRGGYASPIAASPVPPDPSAPIDLSLKRPAGDLCTPVCCPLSPAHSSSPLLLSPTDITQPAVTQIQNPDVWDLSTKSLKRKIKEESTQQPKPVKLFKPYLDDLHDSNSEDSQKTHEIFAQDSPPKCSTSPSCCSTPYDYYYNNNNIYDTYTIQELHPKNSVVYYCPFTSYPLYPSPDLDVKTEPYPYDDSLPKQRQSYSLDFKLSAIECYHQDEFCRGNQRAVATKYNIHRRQVQKWLQQEDELRQRNDNVKQIHVS